VHEVEPAMKFLLDRGFATLVQGGTLRITYADGETRRYGSGAPEAAIRLTTAAAERAIALDPYVNFAECYVDGTLRVEAGRLIDVLMLLGNGRGGRSFARISRVLRGTRYVVRRVKTPNLPGRARRNVAHHYDLSGALYDLFLDADRQYSCAYFETPNATLEDAQLAKKRHVAAKLLVEPGQHVLDIGSGWGGMALYLAQTCGARVTGITLSREQLDLSRRRAREAGLDGQVAFELMDYRAVEGAFDRIVSVGMFEHVGVNHFGTYFRAVQRLLKPDGVMLLHSIGRFDPPGITNPFLAKYIFPGGYIPALSEVLAAFERTGLLSADIEILRLHYAETLKAWGERFEVNRAHAVALYDERFARIWEMYLAGSEAAFRNGHMIVFQLQIVKDQTAVPLTRAYIDGREARLRAREADLFAPPVHERESLAG
jgi:cyclopropane-fatty-acyl-phospholipid synthase